MLRVSPSLKKGKILLYVILIKVYDKKEVSCRRGGICKTLLKSINKNIGIQVVNLKNIRKKTKIIKKQKHILKKTQSPRV